MHDEHERRGRTRRERLRTTIHRAAAKARDGSRQDPSTAQLAMMIAFQDLLAIGLVLAGVHLSILPAFFSWTMIGCIVMQVFVIVAMNAGWSAGYTRAVEDERASALRQAQTGRS
jgi:hypothetical protein